MNFMMYRLSKKNIAIILMTVLSFLVAYVQPFGLSPDYLSYEFFFQEVRPFFDGQKYESRFEPGFFYVSIFLTQVFESDLAVYGLFVLFSIYIKLKYGLKGAVGIYFWVAGIFYFFKYFSLHELTQLRAALSAAFLIVAFFYTQEGNRRVGLFACFIAALFHYSALIIFPFIFLPRLDRRQIIFAAAIALMILSVFAPYLINLAGANFQVFEMYGDFKDRLRPLNRFSPVFFPEFFIILFSLIFWGDLTDVMKRVVTVEIIGFSLFYAFYDYGVVAVRGRELFSIFWLFYVAQGAFCGFRMRLGLNIFVISSIAISVYLFFINDFFTPSF